MPNHPFLAFDLETTGLDDQRDQILQIGAVAYGGEGDPSEFEVKVKRGRYTGDPFALQMNAALLRAIADGAGSDPETALGDFLEFIKSRCARRPHPVGFNVGQFDVAFVRAEIRRLWDPDDGHYWKASHRCVELGTLWAGPDGKPTTSTEVTSTYLHSEVTHDALQDAIDAAALHARWVLWRSGGAAPAPAWASQVWETYGGGARSTTDDRLTDYPGGVRL